MVSGESKSEDEDLKSFLLTSVLFDDAKQIIVLKDVAPHFNEPVIVSCLKEIAEKSCNGGDVEFAVNQAIENRYIAFAKQNDSESRLMFDDVKAVFEDKDTKSVSETLKEKIDALLAELAKYPFRNASRE